MSSARTDGFAGYTSCPSLPCTGTLASNCAASGECLVGLALLHLNETCELQRREATTPSPFPPSDPKASLHAAVNASLRSLDSASALADFHRRLMEKAK